MGRSLGYLRRSRLWVGLLLVVPLAGCWPQIGGDAGNTHFNGAEKTLTHDTVTSLHELWSEDNRFDGYSEPIIWGNRVFATVTREAGGIVPDFAAVEARNATTRQVLWQHFVMPPGGTHARVGSVVYIDGALWVASIVDGMPSCTSLLERLDPATGAVLSSEETGEIVSPLVGAGPVVAHIGVNGCTTQNTLVVRDVATRAVLWAAVFPTTPTQPVFVGDKILVSAGDTLYAFAAAGCGSATCTPAWTRSDGTGSWSRPAAGAEGQVVAIHASGSAGPGNVRVFAVADGTPLWQTAGDPNRYASGIAVGYDKVYVTMLPLNTSTTPQLAVYPATGCGASPCAPLWTVPFLTPEAPGVPTVGGGLAYLSVSSTAPFGSFVVAVDAQGCGAAVCGEVKRVELSALDVLPATWSLAGGHLIGGGSDTDLVAFGP